MTGLRALLVACALFGACAPPAAEPAPASTDAQETREANAALQGFFGGNDYRVTQPEFLSSTVYPEVVALTRGEDPKTFCSGVLVDANTVLTAAHCVCGPPFSVHFGETVPGAISRGVRYRRISAGARCALNEEDEAAARASRRGRDLALVTLQAGVDHTRFEAPAFFVPSQPVDRMLAHRYVMITGFGATYPGGEASGRLAGTVVRILSTACNGAGEPQTYRCRPGRDLVASSRGDGAGLAPDACGGDSGGPVWILTPEGIRMVAAIVSRRLPGGACGDGGVHTLVSPAIIAELRAQAPLQ